MSDLFEGSAQSKACGPIADDPLDGELWRQIPGYEGLYEASSMGRIRSLDRLVDQPCRWGGTMRRTYYGRVLAPCTMSDRFGYKTIGVHLSKSGKGKSFSVHRLIALAFLGDRHVGHQIAHRDGDATNNHLANLRYASASENCLDKRAHGTSCAGEAHWNARLTAADVREIRLAPSAKSLAARFGVAPSTIYRIRAGRKWVHLA